MIRRLRDLRGLDRIDHAGVMLAIGVYVLAAVFGWALVGALIVLWWHP
jgi:hypothetical protein